MTQITVKIDDLKKSVSNVRSKHSKDDIAMMAASIKHRGIINPPSVAKNGDGRYEVVAGFLRTLGAAKAGYKELSCIDVTALSDSERVEISLSENVDRRQMTAMQYYAAFNKLFKAGMPVEKIGERFNKTEREVQQLLAIGSLPKKLHDLADAGVIGDRTLQALAIAPPPDVSRYNKLTPKERPRDWDIQKWLAGDKGMYMAKHAIFPLELYDGPKITDLFAKEDEIWLTDGEQFSKLQKTAIKEHITDLVKKGWVMQQVEYWQSWAYVKTSKANGGKVIWFHNKETGEVQFHAGYKRTGTAGGAPKSKDDKPATKPATSKAFDDYCTELRHNAVRAHMVNDKRAGLIGTVVLLLKQCDGIQFRYSGGRVKNQAYIDSINEQDDNLDIQDARLNTWTELGVLDGHTWDIDIPKLYAKLEEMPVACLQRYIVSIVTANWYLDSDGKDSDALGKAFGLNGVDQVTLDDAFWDGITNKKTLIAIAKENKIAINEKHTAKVIRGRVKDGVPESWLPDFLTF
jgi:ParB/RepB/Spo0J family partition protein